MKSYLESNDEKDCVGCEACSQVCPKHAITIQKNKYGFTYPTINYELCVGCGLCKKVCLSTGDIKKHDNYLLSYGGYINDKSVRINSTSGGAFSAICRAFCKNDYAVFGCTSDKLNVFHTYVEDVNQVKIFNSSKYAQSRIGQAFINVKNFLINKKNVLFSGTPCQIYALYKFLEGQDVSKLLTIEVLCTGIPSSLFMEKYNAWCVKKYGEPIKCFNYRYTNNNRWDDQPTLTVLENGKRIVTARWFSNFYSIFLQRLMSRPSCNACRFVSKERVADITLSDLWGVDKESPDLYDNGSGCSWVICNSEKGLKVFNEAKSFMTGHEVSFDSMKKYQRPGMIKKDVHKDYKLFMEDLVNLEYDELCKKWAKKPTIKLLYQKYIYNNRARVRMWKIKKIFSHKSKKN